MLKVRPSLPHPLQGELLHLQSLLLMLILLPSWLLYMWTFIALCLFLSAYLLLLREMRLLLASRLTIIACLTHKFFVL